MKKSAGIVFIALFLVLCCLPGALFPFFASEEAVGKEERQELPSPVSGGWINTGFSDAFNTWFTQHIPFRPEIITAKNKIDSGVLLKSSSNVIPGANGQLFTEEETNDYLGVTVSDREIHNIARTLLLMQRYCEANGARFVFTCAPNKSTIYPEYMPTGYIRGESSNLSLLEKELEKQGVSYADIKSELLNYKKQGQEMYLRTDTHWNNLSAEIAFNRIYTSLGHSGSIGSADYQTRTDWEGDLAKMLYPSSVPLCRQYYFDTDLSSCRIIKPRDPSMTQDEIIENLMGDSETMDTQIQSVNPGKEGKAFISRDSFFRSMIPSALSGYGSVYMTRYRGMELKNMNGYTDVIYEMVERKLDSITDAVPQMYALPSDVKGLNMLEVGDKTSLKTEKTPDSVVVFGLIDERELSADSNIYVIADNNGTETAYEAFPVTDTERLGLEQKSEYGYCAILPLEAADGAKLRLGIE